MQKNTKNRVRKKKEIDRIDCDIIRLLQKNGRISNSMIARKIGVSEATVRTHLNRLIRDKVIQVVAVGDPFKLGFGVSGIVRIRVDVKKVDLVVQRLKNIEEIWYIALATGSTDIDTEFNVRSLGDLNVLLFEKISKIPGILQMDTSLVLRFAKRDYGWGVAANTESYAS